MLRPDHTTYIQLQYNRVRYKTRQYLSNYDAYLLWGVNPAKIIIFLLLGSDFLLLRSGFILLGSDCLLLVSDFLLLGTEFLLLGTEFLLLSKNLYY